MIELEWLARRTTRMCITAKQGWLPRERATAGEIVARTERQPDGPPTLTRKGR